MPGANLITGGNVNKKNSYIQNVFISCLKFLKTKMNNKCNSQFSSK